MQPQNSEQSRMIDFIRFPLVLMVLFIHIHAIDFSNCLGIQHLNEGSFGQKIYTIFAITFDTLSTAAVPVFFFLSGYLFFIGCKSISKDFYLNKLKKRIHTLLIPYILWNIVAQINTFSIPWLGHEATISRFTNPDALPWLGFLWNSTTMCVDMRNWWGLDIQLYYPQDIALWFVRDLIVMCILSPLVYLFIKKLKFKGIILLSILYWLGIPNLSGLEASALFFFSFGAYFSLNNIELDTFAKEQGAWWGSMAVLLLTLTVSTQGLLWNQMFLPFYCLSAIGAFIYISYLCVAKLHLKMPNAFVQSCFFIYAVHLVVFGKNTLLSLSASWAEMIIGKPFVETSFGSFLEVLLTLALTAGSGVTIYMLLKRCSPTLTGYFTGGR